MKKQSPHIKLAPSILTADFGCLTEEIKAAEAGGADYIHLDIMDGVFVPNISFGMSTVHAVRQATSLPLDVHLMLQNPDPYLAEFAKAGADILTIHQESCLHLHRTIQQILDLGCKVGVALNPGTNIETLHEVLPLLDMVLIMSVNPGFGGQRFIETTLNKICKVRQLVMALNPTCEIEVDGGVGVHNIDEVVYCGANVIVAGSAVFDGKKPVAENIRALRSAYARYNAA